MILSDPTYVPVIAALSGVAVTLAGQAVAGVVQRRHERVNKLFDVKLALYEEVTVALGELRDAKKRHKSVSDTFNGNRQSYQGAIRRRSDLADAIRKFQADHLTSEGLQPSERATELAAEATELIKRYETASSEVEAIQVTLAGFQEGLTEALAGALSSAGTVRGLLPRMSLIADESTINALGGVIRGAKDPTAELADLTPFSNAVRRELGSRQPRSRSVIARLVATVQVATRQALRR